MTLLPTWPPTPGPQILTLAGNDLTIDARARKTARSLATAGYSVIALGIDSAATQPRNDRLGDAALHRVVPRDHPRLSPRGLRLSPSEIVERLAHETELQRARLQLARRNLVADRGIGSTSPWRTRLRATRTVSLQARHQATSALYRASVRAQRRRPAIAPDWRRDLPEMHKWEVAIGPIVDHLGPDLVHCHDIFHLGLAVRAAARARRAGRRLRVVYDAQEYVAGLPTAPWRRAAYTTLEAEYIHRADAVVTVSDGLGALLEQRYHLRPSVVMNAPEAKRQCGVTPLRKIVGLPDEAVLAAYVGGLAPDRGPDVLIEALGRLPADHHVAFVSNASDTYRQTLQQVADRHGVSARVHFAPYVAPEAVTSYVAGTDLTVIPLSRSVPNYEVALPNKLFQSIHAGVPVVVSDSPEMANFVRSRGVGHVFRGGDADELADATRRVVADRAELRTRLADPGLLDEVSWERQVETLLSVYGSTGLGGR